MYRYDIDRQLFGAIRVRMQRQPLGTTRGKVDFSATYLAAEAFLTILQKAEERRHRADPRELAAMQSELVQASVAMAANSMLLAYDLEDALL